MKKHETTKERDPSAEDDILALAHVQKVCGCSWSRLRMEYIDFCTPSVVATDVESSFPS